MFDHDPESREELLRAARDRLAPARRLADRGAFDASLLLSRQAMDLLLRAATPPSSSDGGGAWAERFERVRSRPGVVAPAEVGRVQDALEERDAGFADLPIDALRNRADERAVVAGWLESLLETSSPRVGREKRAMRMAGLGLTLLCVAGLLLARALRPRNVALHRPARSSSVAFGTTPAGAVDGLRYAQLGFNSDKEESPWLTIDLGRDHVLSRVEAYGRSDCCFDEALPLAFEVSRDGIGFVQVARTDTPFTQEDPWIFAPKGVVARYVRMHTLRRSVLVLSEVEVYGWPK